MTLAARIAAPIWWLVSWANGRHREERRQRKLQEEQERQQTIERVLERQIAALPRCKVCGTPFSGVVGELFCSQQCGTFAAAQQNQRRNLDALAAFQQQMNQQAAHVHGIRLQPYWGGTSSNVPDSEPMTAFSWNTPHG